MRTKWPWVGVICVLIGLLLMLTIVVILSIIAPISLIPWYRNSPFWSAFAWVLVILTLVGGLLIVFGGIVMSIVHKEIDEELLRDEQIRKDKKNIMSSNVCSLGVAFFETTLKSPKRKYYRIPSDANVELDRDKVVFKTKKEDN